MLRITHRSSRRNRRMLFESFEQRLALAHNIILDFDGGLLNSADGYLVPSLPEDTLDNRVYLPMAPLSNGNLNEQILQIVAAVRDDFAAFDVNVIWDNRGTASPHFRPGTEDSVVMIVADLPVFSFGTLFGIASDVDVENDNGLDTSLVFASNIEDFFGPTARQEMRDVVYTITHEIGHNVGLSHASEADSQRRLIVDNVGGADTNLDSHPTPEEVDHNAPETGVVYSEVDRLNQTLGPNAVVPVDPLTGLILPLDPTRIGSFNTTTGASGAIDFDGDRDAFIFTATTTETVRLRQRAVSGDLQPSHSLWDEDGVFIASGIELGDFSDMIVDLVAGETYWVVAGSTFDRLETTTEITTGTQGEYILQILPPGEGDTVAFADFGNGYTTDEDTPFTTRSVLLNDFAGDFFSPLTIIDVDLTGTVGIVIDNGDGTFDYDPNGLFNDLNLGDTATTSFRYTVTDGDTSDTATVTITLTGLPDPNAVADLGDGFTTDEDTPFTTASLVINDLPIAVGDELRVFSFDTTGLMGSLTDNGDGTFTYDPEDHFQYLQVGQSATTSFTYIVTDDDGGFDDGVVTIEITGLNDAPTAADDGVESVEGFVTSENERFTTANVLDNDFDIDAVDTIRFGYPAPTGNPVNLNNWVSGGTGSLNIDTTNTKGIVYDNGDGTFDYDPNGMFEGLADDAIATDTFRYIIFDDRNAVGIGTVTITIAGANAAPLARAGGPYFVKADEPLTLDASRSRDADIGNELSYRWDVNGDGHFNENVAGKVVTLSPEQLAALGVQSGVRVVTVAVSDGLTTSKASATLSVGAGPQVTISGPAVGVPGQTLSYRFASSGDGNVRYDIDWNSDGVVDQSIDGPASGVFASRVFEAYGPVTISASAFNASNEIIAAGQQEVTLQGAVLAGNVLYAGGTADRDLIEFKPGATAGTVVVRVNRESFGPFTQVTQLIGYGLAGNDTLRVDTTVMMPPARLHGGDGNDILQGGMNADILRGDAGRDLLYGYGGADTLYGGDGHDVLQGGRGNDTLYGEGDNDRVNGGDGNDILRGGVGRDYIVGGLGDDILVGGDGDDRMGGVAGRNVLIGGLGRDLLDPGTDGSLLIGGSTIYDYNDAALRSLLNEWSSSESLDERAGALYQSPTLARQGGSAYWLEFGVTVHDDGSRDLLADGDDEDWYLAFARDTLPATLQGNRVDRA